MSTRKKVSIKNAILQAVDSTSDFYLNSLPVLMKWAKQSYVRINGFYSCKEDIIHLTCVGNRAELPLDAVRVNYIFHGNVDVTTLLSISNAIATYLLTIFTDGQNQVLLYSGTVLPSPTGIGWHVQDNHIIFDTSLDGKEITVSQLILQSDDDHYPLIDEEQVEAIGKFLEIKLAEKENSKKFVVGQLRNSDIVFVKELERKYRRLVGQSRPVTSTSEKNVIAQMLNFPYTGSSVI
jgi:hypothetical protein